MSQFKHCFWTLKVDHMTVYVACSFVADTVSLLAGVDQHGPDPPQSGPPPVRFLVLGAAAGALPLPQPALLSRDRRPRPPGAA